MMAQSDDLLRQSKVMLKDSAALLEDSLQLRAREISRATAAAEPDET